MNCLHAFKEVDKAQQKLHMDRWFGLDLGSFFEDPEGPITICTCGAKLEMLVETGDPKKDVGVVWHRKAYYDTETTIRPLTD